ncbi:MAG: Rieske 2Fe-2S domain-containing protein [Candidatus Dormibacteraeota bacterium]|nr:Rieske 2Fe-2S domain-containing protein [Candidatus Dormibacteraeota bacterium]MBV9524390.1 Rieske 2Fe-2S domain-containing protein [Candidatus Dormibacteraeota bacterium]
MPQPLLERIARSQNWLEPTADWLQKLVTGIYSGLGGSGRQLKSLLNGTFILRHPLHPALTDVPIGAWTVGVIADYAAHFTSRIPESAGDIALAVGLIVALAALITGYTDFMDTLALERRFATAHGLTMTLVIAIDAVSMFLRWFAGAGAHPVAVALSTVGWVLVLVGAWYGGHVVFGTGYAVNREAFLDGPSDWADAGAAADIPVAGLHVAEAGGMQVLLVREGARICALSDVCSHAGGPLHEGTLQNGIVQCPWHSSRFRIRDGRAVGGPATFDQPVLEVREVDGRVMVKLESPLH